MSGSKSKSTSQRGVLATETRVTTGNADADAILGGGFPANSINIIMGAPGTGKTLFAQQLALNNADAKRPVLYFTTLSEPLSKVVTYLQSMSFYDEAKVGSAVLYEDLGNALVTEGPKPGSRGAAVPSELRNGKLVFTVTPRVSGRSIYVTAK